jgi:hypothetical protein
VFLVNFLTLFPVFAFSKERRHGQVTTGQRHKLPGCSLEGVEKTSLGEFEPDFNIHPLPPFPAYRGVFMNDLFLILTKIFS